MEYIPKVVNKEMEKIYEHYQNRFAIYRDRGLDFEAYRRVLFDKAAPLENDILELGAGAGYTTVFLAKEGYELVSIDTDEEALKTTALRLAYDKVLSRVKFYMMNAISLEFGNDSFKSIIAVNLLHHVVEVEKLLLEADRVLSPGGRIIISDFNKEGQEIIDSVHKTEGRSHDYPIADKDRICSLLKKKGYKINKSEKIGYWFIIAQKDI